MSTSIRTLRSIDPQRPGWFWWATVDGGELIGSAFAAGGSEDDARRAADAVIAEYVQTAAAGHCEGVAARIRARWNIARYRVATRARR